MRDYTKEYPYFRWLLKQVHVTDKELADDNGFSFLLQGLHDRIFYAVMERDSYRAADGEILREDFEELTELRCPIDGECTVLEMLVALSLRIEREIMYDHEIGERASEWFWMMIRNLNLSRFDNRHYDERAVNEVITRFLDREYDEYGRGGLFPCSPSKCERDQRTVEIWWQMQNYLREKYWK